ncbi:odorant receptor 33b-like isoform X1 [Hermetia illucens]|uniref:odorant receptor 33b-like isoform X1 n=1 Tax=Hermetia illucens TaxID=343691 RepID=UPI0018CC020F|nr:odorant receptor 33b-like isoform X1 [Hermetia illucens]
MFKYFLIVVVFAVYSKILGFLFTSGEIFILPLWSPFDQHIIMKFLYDFVVIHLLALQAIASDMYPPICFLLLNAHLKILSQQMLRLGVGGRECHTQSNIATIVERHIVILRIYKILDETLSKMYFVQLSVASLELCVSMTSIISRSMELPELMFTVGFAFAAIFEILPICVLADQFQTLSEKLADAAYATNWPDQSFRFAILFIIHRSQNCRLILAGGIVPINLSDFSQYCAIRLLFLSNLYNDILIKI